MYALQSRCLIAAAMVLSAIVVVVAAHLASDWPSQGRTMIGQTGPFAVALIDKLDRETSADVTQKAIETGETTLCLFPTPQVLGSALRGDLPDGVQLADLSGPAPTRLTQDGDSGIHNCSMSSQTSPVRGADPRRCAARSRRFETLVQYRTTPGLPTATDLESDRARLWMLTLLAGGLLALLLTGVFRLLRQSRSSQRRESEAKSPLATTLDHITDGFITLDRTWRITYANTQAALITGRSKEQMIGSSALDPGANLDGIPTDKALVFAMEGKGTAQFVGKVQDGRALDATAYPTRDGIAVLFRDVTKERERVDHLRLLEAAVARQNDVLIITDTGTGSGADTQKIVYVNDAFVRLTGYSRAEVIGRSPRLLQGPGTSHDVLDQLRQAKLNRQPTQVEILHRAKNGTEYWIELNVAPIFDSDGTCTHFVAVQRDITERKRVQAQSDYNLERFLHIVEATDDIIWDADLATGLVKYNENLKKSLGHDPAIAQPTRKGWEDWVHPDDRVRLIQTIADAVATQTVPVDMEYRIRRADGSYATVTDRAKIIRDATGKPTRIVGVMSDVTERRALAERLRQSQQLEAVGQLTGGVAHDFNNLLTVILGNSELLADRLAGQPQLQKLAEMTVTMALRGADLTSRLLAFARRQPLEPKLIDVNTLVAATEAWMSRTLPDSVKIEITGAPDLWQIEADPHQLENALLNLAVNARDAMPQGGLLTIRTANWVVDPDFARHLPEAKPGDYVRISMTDTGTGMDAATRAHAFEPFFTTKAMGKGSGLGLSMVYGFLRQSAGFATIESIPGQGTTVHLYFPRLSSEKPMTKPAAGPEHLIGGTEHILAVEDEEIVLENVVAKLEGLGYRVSAAATGTAALEILARDATIDLLFTDVVMPADLSGPDLVKRAGVLRPDLKVLYTSGYTDDTIIHDGKVDAGLSLLSKPYRLVDLAEKIRSVLDGSGAA